MAESEQRVKNFTIKTSQTFMPPEGAPRSMKMGSEAIFVSKIFAVSPHPLPLPRRGEGKEEGAKFV